jgi:hypothetical protein
MSNVRYLHPGPQSSEHRLALTAGRVALCLMLVGLAFCVLAFLALVQLPRLACYAGMCLVLSGAVLLGFVSAGYSIARGRAKASALAPPAFKAPPRGV